MVRVGLLEVNRGLESENLPGPVRERREGVAARGRSRVLLSRRDPTKMRATLEYRSRNLALEMERLRGVALGRRSEAVFELRDDENASDFEVSLP